MMLLYLDGDVVTGYHPEPETLTNEQLELGVLFDGEYPKISGGQIVRFKDSSLQVENANKLPSVPLEELVLILMEQVADLSIQVEELKGVQV